MCGASDTAHLSQTETIPPPIKPFRALASHIGNRYCSAMSKPTDRQGTRINLTIPPDVLASIDRMCALGGIGRATFIREFLTDMKGHLNGLADAMDLAKKNNIDAFKVMADTLREVSQASEQIEMDLRKQRRAAMRKRKP